MSEAFAAPPGRLCSRVGGSWRQDGATYAVVNPSTGELLGDLARGGREFTQAHAICLDIGS